jgi:polyhydroxyalkanoate synthase
LSEYTEFAPLSSSKIIENWIEYSKSNMNLLPDYGLSYINTILNLFDLKQAKDGIGKKKNKITNWNNNNNHPFLSFTNPVSFYDSLLNISNFEFSKQLRSYNSLQHFKDHINSIINLESSIRQTFPYNFPLFSFTDNFIDNNLKFLEPIVSLDETPYEVVRQEDATRLLYYYDTQNSSKFLSSKLPSEGHSTESIPLFMVYAPINRYHILDLSSQRSIVRKFVSAGFDVFLLDWGEKQSENKPTIKDYINYIDKSIEHIQKIIKQDKINLYGYSWGGTLAIIYTSLYNNNKIKNLILQSANFDFDKDDTVIAEWMRNFPAEAFIDEFKEMFGHFIDLAFLMRNPIAHSFDNLKYAVDIKENEPIKFVQNLVKLRAWINNTPDLPGPLFKQFVMDLYQNNLLAKNQLILKEEKEGIEAENNKRKEKTVDLKNISIPILNIVANKDDLVSSKSSIPITEQNDNNRFMRSKEKKLIEFPSNHVELCISYDAHRYLWPQVIDWLKERS